MDPLLIFDVAKLVPLAAVLSVAAWQDHKTGEASNKLWLYAPVGFALTLTEYVLFAPAQLLMASISLVLAVGLSLFAFYVGAWGGADAKALMTVAASAPLTAYNFTVFLPFATYMFAVAVMVLFAAVKRQKTMRFLPCMLVGFVAACII